MKFYLPQLDGLRFFAFFLVFFHHSGFDPAYLAHNKMLAKALFFLGAYGWMGVDLFLVLSSFLITKLLLLEYEKNGSISVRSFWVRRILRIWPLYFLMIAIGFLALPLLGLAPWFSNPSYVSDLKHHLIPSLLILGNYSAGFFSYIKIHPMAHLWTVCLEEQFYLLWPILFVYLLKDGEKAIYRALFLLLCFTLSFRFFLTYHSTHPMVWTNTFSRLDPLLSGIFLAVYRNSNPGKGNNVFWELIFGVLCLSGILLFKPMELQSHNVVWEYLLISIGFLLIVDSCLHAVGLLKRFFSIKGLVWLGKLSYGLYVFHLLAIKVVRRTVAQMNLGHTLGPWLMVVALSFAFTVFLAVISYYFFEMRFLRLKSRYTFVESRPA